MRASYQKEDYGRNNERVVPATILETPDRVGSWLVKRKVKDVIVARHHLHLHQRYIHAVRTCKYAKSVVDIQRARHKFYCLTSLDCELTGRHGIVLVAMIYVDFCSCSAIF